MNDYPQGGNMDDEKMPLIERLKKKPGRNLWLLTMTPPKRQGGYGVDPNATKKPPRKPW